MPRAEPRTIEEHALAHGVVDRAPGDNVDGPGVVPRTLELRQAIGGGLVIAGLLAMALAWWGVSGTDEPWKQFPYLASGGVGGAGLIAVGIAFILSYEHDRDRAAIGALLTRLGDMERELHRVARAVGAEADPVVGETRVERATTPRNGPARGRPRK